MDGSLMWTEMQEQPEALRRIIKRRDELVEALRTVLPEHVVGYTLVARGSSDHAALFGRYLIEVATGRPVALAAPSIHTVYGAHVDHRDWVAIGVSQSGRTDDVARTLVHLREAGAVTVAITNDGDSPLTAAADVAVGIDVGQERSIPATKTFTGELAILALVAEALGSVPWGTRQLDEVCDVTERLLADGDRVRLVARRLMSHPSAYCVGRGYLFPLALEAALKLKEVARFHAEGWSSADLRHGPIALATPGFPVLALAAGPGSDDVRVLTERLRARGARVVTVGDDPDADLGIGASLPEPLTTIPVAVRIQQLAWWSARVSGVDPDGTVGLTKVTR